MEKIETSVIKPDVKVEENGKEYLLINNEVENLLDDKLNSIKEYIFTNSGKGKTNQEKDASQSIPCLRHLRCIYRQVFHFHNDNKNPI